MIRTDRCELIVYYSTAYRRFPTLPRLSKHRVALGLNFMLDNVKPYVPVLFRFEAGPFSFVCVDVPFYAVL